MEGIDFKTLPIGTKFKCNDVVLELTQIGKECHHGCAIFQAMGDCIMPREGVFTKVLHGGVIKKEIIWRFWKKRRKEIKERWETNESSNYYIQ